MSPGGAAGDLGQFRPAASEDAVSANFGRFRSKVILAKEVEKLSALRTANRTVGIVNIELNDNMEFAPNPSSLQSGAQRISLIGHRRVVGPQILSHTPVGEPRASAPAWRAASLREAA